MAIDFLILALLIVSFLINLLALSAFWITPGLRTTANRFTINLLIINLIGCIILAPTLFLSGSNAPSVLELKDASTHEAMHANAADSIEFYSKPGNHQMTIRYNGKLVEHDGVIVRRHNTTKSSSNITSSESDDTIETIYKCNSTYCRELTIDERSDGDIVITEIEEDNFNMPTIQTTVLDTAAEEIIMQKLQPVSMRCWSIDMTAALGALAVLLVVGDTWCAVTDPLRYHSRISGLRTWVFIALVWLFGLLFGALSAFRVINFESDTLLSKHRRFAATYFNISSTNSIFGMAYAAIYFVVIILLPFGFVCGMYWRIFSEARGNGLRMRQNGSSPLLQSALNLTHQQSAGGGSSGSGVTGTLQYSNNLCVHRHSISSASSHGGGSTNGTAASMGGLQMSIDQQRKSSPNCMRRDSAAKVLLPTISDDGSSDDADSVCKVAGHLVAVPEHADRNQNILLTLQAASGEIKRNYSARQLPLLGTSSQDLHASNRLERLRQVHSSPNLQEYTQLCQDSLSDECSSPHLLTAEQHHVHLTPRQHLNFSSTRHHQLQLQHQHHHSQPSAHHNQQQHHHHPHVLQIPAIHASPKALSYMSSLRHRLSNASSLFKYREESRAARISILVVIMFLVSYLPFGFLVLLQSRLSAANFESSTQLAIFMILLANVSSPFIFAYRNKRVRRGVKRLFGLDARCALQRQCSSSLKTNGAAASNVVGISGSGSGSGSGGNSSNGQLQRNSSKISNFSTNSCKYLTPQTSIVGSCAQSSGLHTSFTLRPNSSCSTIINFSISKEAKSSAESDDLPAAALSIASEECQQTLPLTQPTPAIRPVRPKLQRGITIVEHIPIPAPKFQPKRGLFDMFFRGSKKLQSCAYGVKQTTAPTEV